jgi:hypothetical protein
MPTLGNPAAKTALPQPPNTSQAVPNISAKYFCISILLGARNAPLFIVLGAVAFDHGYQIPPSDRSAARIGAKNGHRYAFEAIRKHGACHAEES